VGYFVKFVLIFAGIFFGLNSLADERPAEQSKAFNFFNGKYEIHSFTDESFSGEPKIINFNPPAEVNKVTVNDVDNPVIKYIGLPLANVIPEPIVTHKKTFEIFIYFDNGEVQNCYVSFVGDSSEPILSRCKKY
jgi:hypothetical protein